MAGGSEGRERVCGKIKSLSAAQGASQDSSVIGSLCSGGDPCCKSSSLSWSCKITKTQTHVRYAIRWIYNEGNSFLLNQHISCWSCFLRKWFAHEWRYYERSPLRLTAAKKRLQWNSFNCHTINKSWNIIILRVRGRAAFKQNFPATVMVSSETKTLETELSDESVIWPCQEEECIHFQYQYKEDNNRNMKHLVSYSINKVQSR